MDRIVDMGDIFTEKNVSMPGGRPTIFTQNLADQICEMTANSNKSLTTICKELSVSRSAVIRWMSEPDKEWFKNNYARAKEDQADFLFEEILAIADDTSNDTITDDEGNERINQEWVQRSKLRIETRKWAASKLKSKKYGDKIDVTTDGEKINQQSIDLNKLSTETLTELIKAANDTGDKG